MRLMQNMLGFYHQQTRRKHGLTDTQLEHVQLSLGHRTLQLAGLRECSWSEPEKHVEFQFYWRQYESGETLDDGGMSAFRKATNYLRQAVLQRADAVVTTDIRENFRPAIALVLVDEAAKTSEPELWPLPAWFNPEAYLLVGDQKQLRPVVMSSGFENPLGDQLQLSLFNRLHLSGFMDTMLNLQHRMHPDIAALIQEVFYDNRLLNVRLK